MKCKFNYAGKTTEIEMKPNEGILEAALRAGISPPYSCLEGICGTCEALLESGQATFSKESLNAPVVIKTCLTRPMSDINVNYDKA